MSNRMQYEREMPRYRCYKEVMALKICAINIQNDGSAFLQPESPSFVDGYPGIYVSKHFAETWRPLCGGYYIVDEDGYKSFSLPKIFEAHCVPVCDHCGAFPQRERMAMGNSVVEDIVNNEPDIVKGDD